MLRILVALFYLSIAPAYAQTCPPVADQSARFADLVAGANAAKNESAAREFTGQMWEIWATAPDQKAQEMLDVGMQRFSEYNFEAAEKAFGELIAYCPDYAEGYNQRAFVNFLRNNHALALDDLERALERSPNHFAAMAGMALTLTRLGRVPAAQSILREALKLNPWLSERSLLIEAPGKDI